MRGEGGAVFEMTLPLDPNIEQRYLNGDIQRVNPDGTPWHRRPARNARAREAGAQMLKDARGD
jgi:hypothetical protein